MTSVALALWVALAAPDPGELLRRVLSAAAPAQARVEVTASWPGASAPEVEALLLTPLEAALLPVAGVGRIESTALAGEARVAVFGARGADPHALLRATVEALSALGRDWPEAVERPLVRLHPPGLRRLAWMGRIDPATLLRIPGVRAVEPCAEVPRVVVRTDPRRLRAFGVGLREVARALAVPPRLRSAAAGRYRVRVAGDDDLGSLGETVVETGRAGAPVRLANLAEIRVEPGPRSCACHHRGARAECGSAWVTAQALEAARSAALTAGAQTASAAVVVEADGGPRLAARLPPELWVRVEGEAVAVLAPTADAALLRTLDAIPGVAWRPPDPTASLCVAGPDRGTLRALAGRVATRLRAGGGRVLQRAGAGDEPSLLVTPDRRRLAAFGLTARAVADTVAAATSGLLVGRRQRGRASLDLVLQVGDGAGSPQAAVEVLREVKLDAPKGAAVPLTSVAAVQLESVPRALERCDGRRGVLIDVWGPAPDLTDLARAIEFPPGYSVELRDTPR